MMSCPLFRKQLACTRAGAEDTRRREWKPKKGREKKSREHTDADTRWITQTKGVGFQQNRRPRQMTCGRREARRLLQEGWERPTQSGMDSVFTGDQSIKGLIEIRSPSGVHFELSLMSCWHRYFSFALRTLPVTYWHFIS